jgi:hypothetical protein
MALQPLLDALENNSICRELVPIEFLPAIHNNGVKIELLILALLGSHLLVDNR